MFGPQVETDGAIQVGPQIEEPMFHKNIAARGLSAFPNLHRLRQGHEV
jgi:hypothetical protein